ncbi:MAG: aromatic compound degradation protein PaaI [Pseudonocardiales bacterium]|nr:MAG: aromatic compound degradation protein PaaI [Pseudonocardiales bacterium]
MSDTEGDRGADLTELLHLTPFAETVGIALDSAEAAEVRGRLAWSPERCTAGGVLHGGALMALADSLGALCAYLNLPCGAQTTTVTSNSVFMRGVRSGDVTGVAHPLHTGRTIIVIHTDLLADNGTLVAQVTQNQAVLTGRA